MERFASKSWLTAMCCFDSDGNRRSVGRAWEPHCAMPARRARSEASKGLVLLMEVRWPRGRVCIIYGNYLYTVPQNFPQAISAATRSNYGVLTSNCGTIQYLWDGVAPATLHSEES